MTLKIEKNCHGGKTVIRLSGRLQSEHLDELKTQIRGNQSGVVFDLEGVTLVDVEGRSISERMQGKRHRTASLPGLRTRVDAPRTALKRNNF
jgi:hypothetical protein